MSNLKKIVIIGNAGSGKSFLAQQLHTILQLPVYHLDHYFWKPNWTYPDPDEYKKIHDQLCDQDEWIIEGMQLKLLEYRIQKADLVIFLDMPRSTCFYQIFKRTFTYYGKQAPSSAKGCPERIDWKFLKFLKWVWNFKKNYRPRIVKLFNEHATTKKLSVLQSKKEIDQLIEKLSLNK